MNRRNQIPKARKPDHGRGNLIPPAEMFSRVLSGRFAVDTDLPFEQRVERALARLKLTRFAPDEHERLRTAMAEMLKEKHTLKDQIDE